MQTASLTTPSPAKMAAALRERPSRLIGLRLNDEQRSSIRSTLKRNRIGRVRERRVPTASREAAENYLDSGKERVLSNEDLSDRSTFLNRLCDLIEGTHPDQLNHKPFFEKISDVMRELLQDDHQSIRAMALRILRLCLFNEHNMVHILKTNVEIFVVRSLDLRANNDAERVAAFRIIYQLIAIYEKSNYKKMVNDRKKQKNQSSYAFPKSVMQPVIAIGLAALRPIGEQQTVQSPQKAQCRSLNEKESMEDPLGLPSVALLMEFAVYEPDLTLEMAGTDWMVRVLTGEVVVSRRVATLVTRLFVHWLDSPKMRKKAQMNRVLEQIFAPLVDFGFFNNEVGSDESRAKIDTTLETFQHTFLAILRSWSGLLACSAVGSGNTVVSSSPIRLIEYLGLGTVISPSLVRIRSMIVDLIVDFLDLPYADKKFTSWKEAHSYFLSLHEPGVFERSLRNDFVIAHADRRAVHDERLRNHVDVLESFRAIAVYILVNASLPQSLCRLILACPDEPSSLKATLLLSDLIGQAATVLPSEWTSRVLSLPTLLHSSCETISLSTATAAVTKGRPLPDEGKERFTFQHAENAPLVLFRLDELQTAWLKCEEISRSPPSPTSLLALFVPRRGSKNEERARLMDGGRTPSFNDDEDLRMFESLDITSRLAAGPISEHLMTDILSTLGDVVDGPRINWKTAAVFLDLMQKDPKMVDRFRSNATVLSFMEKLLAWLAPSARNLCRTKTTDVLPAAVGKLAIECLMRLSPEEQLFREILEQFANDFVVNLRPSVLSTGAFSSKHVNFNGAMYYFALLASYASHSLGSTILERAGVMQIFLDLMADSTLAEHVKLIVCSIDYSKGGLARIILNKALTATNEQSRVWCTRFLEVLASLDLPQFADWGVRMMIGQIGDASVKVVRHAVRLLHTWLPLHPSSLPLLRAVPLHTLGDAGVLLRVHLFSCETETRKNMSAAREVVDFWMMKFNARYAATVEEEMRMALLGIKRSMDGRFARSSHEKHSRYGVRMPSHLFAALASHQVGRRLLKEEAVVKRLTEQLRIAPSTDHKAAMLLKAATLALAHIGAAPRGHLLLSSDSLVLMIRLAEESEVLSVRGSAFAALNVLSGSEEGARMLARFGWESNWYRYVAEEVRVETVNRRTSSRLSHHGAGADMDVRPPSASISRPRLSRVRSALSESERKYSKTEEEKRRTGESVRSSSAPARIRVKEVKKKLTLADRSISALPRVSVNSESVDYRLDEEEEGGGMEIEADVPIEILRGTFGDHDDDAFLPSGQRSRRCTTVSIGPLSPVSSASFCLDPSSSVGGIRGHSESITDCIRYGMRAGRKELTADNERIFAGEWTRRPHFSSALRQQWKLAPILMTKSSSVNRSFGAPVSYYFMPQTELESLAEYRHTIDADPWLKRELERTRPLPGLPLMDGRGVDGGWGEMPPTRRGRSLSDHSTWTNIALPTELEIVCKGIFIEDDAVERKIRANSRTISMNAAAADAGHDDNRGQKGGYGRVRLEGKKKKHTSHCFYCTAQPGEVRPFHVPNASEFAQLRLQVLDAVDLLEIKHALPEKKLLELRRRHPTLFDWPCLYADVLELLDEYRFKAQSRTFLQELFYNALRLTRSEQSSIL
uniref:Rict-1 n=1 Tax=Pristionchus pacificus TaxID=54126 RepID=A0A8R1U555_PRIPA